MRSIDIFIGVKAEQTLRDAARNAAEESPEGADMPELCPVGKKDWIAGKRYGPSIPFGELETKRADVVKALIALGSHQRIRQDNLRIYAVRPPVPVFKDAEPATGVPSTGDRAEGETMFCPVCGLEVHKFNLQYGTDGRPVGCYLCRGEPPTP
jgi:hypothetical protein